MYDRVWRWRNHAPYGFSVAHPCAGRFGQPCRYVAVGTRNSALVEFDDGHRVVASRYALRRAPDPEAPQGARRSDEPPTR